MGQPSVGRRAILPIRQHGYTRRRSTTESLVIIITDDHTFRAFHLRTTRDSRTETEASEIDPESILEMQESGRQHLRPLYSHLDWVLSSRIETIVRHVKPAHWSLVAPPDLSDRIVALLDSDVKERLAETQFSDILALEAELMKVQRLECV